MFAKKILPAAAVALTLVMGAGLTANASDANPTASPSASRSPMSQASKDARSAANAAKQAAKQAALRQYRVDLAKWQLAKANYNAAVGQIQDAYSIAVAAAGVVQATALNNTATGDVRAAQETAANNVYKAAVAAAKATRDAAIAKVPAVPAKPQNPEGND